MSEILLPSMWTHKVLKVKTNQKQCRKKILQIEKVTITWLHVHFCTALLYPVIIEDVALFKTNQSDVESHLISLKSNYHTAVRS